MEERFADACRRVCDKQGWELLPTGVLLSLERGRRQLVSLEFFEREGVESVRLRTDIGPAPQMSRDQLMTVLRVNAALDRGAVAIDGETLCMVDLLPLADPDPAEIEITIESLARLADEQERILFGVDVN